MKHRLHPKRVSGKRALALTLCPYVVALGTSGIAAAQDTGPAPKTGAQAGVEEVVVTGSRIERSTFNTPNPVTVIDSKDIQHLGITNVGQVLGQLPQNSNFFAANNVGLGNFNVGAQLANLRGLNPFFGTRTRP
jgi:outer membrane cobalamin receptor